MNRILVIALFASLPFFTVRNLTLGYSTTLLVMVVILAVSARHIRRLDGLETSELILLVIAAVSLVFTSNFGAGALWVKSFIYLATFIALRRHMAIVGRRLSLELAIQGTQIGLAGYLVLVVVALAASGQLGTIFQGVEYQTFTKTIHNSIANLVGYDEEFQAADVMRNTMGEIFALTVLLPVAFSSVRNITNRDKLTMVVAFLMTAATFSRRALIAVALVTLLCSGAMSWRLRVVIFGSFAALMFLLFAKIGIENRFDSIDESTRLHQYGVAFWEMLNDPLTGAGYGAQIPHLLSFKGENYVHNYVLSQGYMLGVMGFMFGCAVLYFIARPLVRLRQAPHLALLLLPIIGAMISSTRTPASWVVLALILPSVLPYHASKKEDLQSRKTSVNNNI